MDKLNEYYKLTKPGVLYGNALTASAGFLLASMGHVNLFVFIWLTIGMTLVIASACVLNNFLDQDIDRLMERTKTRPLIQGTISGRGAVIFSIVLGVLGFLTLIAYTNILVVIAAFVGFIVYVVFYGMLYKRLSLHGTLVGSVSGAMPILAGYLAARGRFDVGALIVFLILFMWQMPEFYSISIYRRDEYKKAGVPVISVVKGIAHTKLQIFWYTLAFVVATLSLSVFGYTGIVYTLVMALLGGYWLGLGWKGLRASDSDAWSRQMFRFSLIILLSFSALISVDVLLP